MSSSQLCLDTLSALVLTPASACLCVTYSVSVFLSLPPSLSVFFSLASVHSSAVEEPSPVRDKKAPNGQGPVPLSVICWYRVQSLSFSESCRSLEVKEPGRQERHCFCVWGAEMFLHVWSSFTIILQYSECFSPPALNQKNQALKCFMGNNRNKSIKYSVSGLISRVCTCIQINALAIQEK